MTTATKQIRISLPAMSYDISPFDIHNGRTSFDLSTFCTQFCHAFNDRNEHLPLSTRKDYFAITLRAMQALVFGRDEEQTTNTLHNSLLIDNPDLSTRDLTQLVRLISFYCMDDVDILAAIVARQLKLFKAVRCGGRGRPYDAAGQLVPRYHL